MSNRALEMLLMEYDLLLHRSESIPEQLSRCRHLISESIKEDKKSSQWQPMDTAPKHVFILIKIPCTDAFLDNYVYAGIIQEENIEIYGFEEEYHFSAGECAGWMPRPE